MKYLAQIMIFFFTAFIIVSCQRTQQSADGKTVRKEKKVVHKLNPGDNNPRNSEGDFVELSDGRILFVYSRYTGNSSSDHAPAYLAGRYSTDRGNTWSDDHIVLEREGDMNIMSVSLLRLHNGEIALFYLKKNSTSDCIPLMRISKDEAKTWSEPIAPIKDKKGYFVLNNDRVIQLENGRVLFSVAMHKTPDSKWSGTGRLWSYYSDDNGRTWQSSIEVPNPENIMLQEPGVVELRDGPIMMYIRTDEGLQYQSFSKDEGESWSPAEPANIPSPRSPASIERIPSTGDLLLVWNNNGITQKRTPFNSAISKDEGQTWTNVRTIEDDPDGWYCYTAIHFIEDKVLLGHCAGNRPKGTGLSVTNITSLDLKWIYGQNNEVKEKVDARF
jgi:sialidase-1